jgi:DNA-directed RNA polymerase specialized sigma24 family protein
MSASSEDASASSSSSGDEAPEASASPSSSSSGSASESSSEKDAPESASGRRGSSGASRDAATDSDAADPDAADPDATNPAAPASSDAEPDEEAASDTDSARPERTPAASPSDDATGASGDEIGDPDEAPDSPDDTATEDENEPAGLTRPLTQHLDDLYRAACVLVGAEAADELVRSTYRQAAATPDADRPEAVAAGDAAATRGWLLRLLLDRYDESDAFEEATGLDAFRQNQARQALQRALPAAFAARPQHEQLLLVLCDQDGLSPETAAKAFDLDAAAVRSQLENARDALFDAAYRQLAPAEQALVDASFAEADRPAVFADAVGAQLDQPSARLRAETAAVVEQAPASASEGPESASDPASASAAPTADPAAPSDDDGEAATPTPDGTDEVSGQASRRGRVVRRTVGALLALVVVGLAGYVLYTTLGAEQATTRNLMAVSAQRASTVQPVLQTSDPAEAETFIEQELGRRVTTPSVRRARLTGIGLLTIGSDVSVPVYLYADSTSDRRITAYAYTYALIDRLGDSFRLPTPVRRQLGRAGTVSAYVVDSQQVFAWRQQDDIFLAVASGGTNLQDRVRPALSD